MWLFVLQESGRRILLFLEKLLEVKSLNHDTSLLFMNQCL